MVDGLEAVKMYGGGLTLKGCGVRDVVMIYGDFVSLSEGRM